MALPESETIERVRRLLAELRAPGVVSAYVFDHLDCLRGRVSQADELARDLSLHNDVLFSLTVCQLVIGVAAELAARRGDRFDDYVGAVRALACDPRFPSTLVHQLERLPGFRNVLVHEYVALDMHRVVEALNQLAPIREFVRIVAGIEAGTDSPGPS